MSRPDEALAASPGAAIRANTRPSPYYTFVLIGNRFIMGSGWLLNDTCARAQGGG